jgi:predicted Zn-dependent protease
LIDVAIQAGTGVNTQGVFSDAAAHVFSQEFESEADYEGLYLAARAGFNIADAPDFWRRMAAEHPGSIKKNFAASHPSSPERYLALENAVKEIESKREHGDSLLPEKIRGTRPDSTATSPKRWSISDPHKPK